MGVFGLFRVEFIVFNGRNYFFNVIQIWFYIFISAFELETYQYFFVIFVGQRPLPFEPSRWFVQFGEYIIRFLDKIPNFISNCIEFFVNF